MATVYIGLGSNLGDRQVLLMEARRRLGAVVETPQMSRIFETDPVSDEDQPRYLNAVMSGTTDVPPLRLLREFQTIENALGRERPFPNAARTIDLDLLFYDALVLDTPELILPHPRLHERFFVLVPLAELAPDLRHPRFARTIRELLHVLGPATDICLHSHMQNDR